MPTKKGRIWFINMMNDNEGKVSTEELTLRSNIPRGLASVFSDEYKLFLSLSLSRPPFAPARPVFARLSRTMENETRSRVPTDLSLHSARFIANSSFGKRFARDPVARIEEFLLAGKRISRNLICPLAVGKASRLEENISSGEGA